MSYPAFLAAIRDAPEDEVPRLVCADWLEDNGQPERAEFVRVQLELSRGVEPRSQALALYRRLRALIREHREGWLGSLATHAPASIFDRGFVEQVELEAKVLLEHGAAIFDEHPIHRLALRNAGKQAKKLAGCAVLACLTQLDLRDNSPGDAVALLGGSPHVGRVSMLEARQIGLSDVGVRRLLAGGLRSLQRLNLAGNRFGAAGAAALAQSPHAATLRELGLASTSIDDEGAQALAGSAHLAGLRLLRLSYNEVTEAGARAVLASPNLAGLQQVELYGNELDTAARGRLRGEFGSRVVC
jgi:uncharacterized protein (TIGR02996 family)